MPAEAKHVFWSAVAGNVAPILLKWYLQEGVSVPSETFGRFVGWFLAVVFFAIFAGLVATFIWKERTTQRAFFIGLALPYLLWGFLADAQIVVQPRRARAQAEKPAAPPSPPLWLEVTDKPRIGPPTPLTIQIFGDDAGKKKPLDKATALLLRAYMLTQPGLTFSGSEKTVELWPAKYLLRVGAPGYVSRTVDIEVGADTKILTVELSKSGFFYEMWKGFGFVFSPSWAYP